MADIDIYLQKIMEAVFGEEVRGSIHDALEKINQASEVVLSVGTDVTGQTSSSTGYFVNSLYLNDQTWDFWKCTGTNHWAKLGNIKGAAGKGIDQIEKTGTSGLVDTYTITYTVGTSTTFAVVNGKGIISITKTGSAGLVDTYEITFNDGPATTFEVTNGANGVSVTGVTLYSAVGKIKTYRMSFSDGTHFDYQVEDGRDGSGAGDMLKSTYDKNDDGVVDELASIDDIDDVDTSTNTPVAHEVMEYDATDDKWENKLPEQTYDPTSERVISGKGVSFAVDTILSQIASGSLPIDGYLIANAGDRIIFNTDDHAIVRKTAIFNFA